MIKSEIQKQGNKGKEELVKQMKESNNKKDEGNEFRIEKLEKAVRGKEGILRKQTAKRDKKNNRAIRNRKRRKEVQKQAIKEVSRKQSEKGRTVVTS